MPESERRPLLVRIAGNRNAPTLDLVLAGLGVLLAYVATNEGDYPGWLEWLAALAIGAPVAVRRRWPLGALAAVLLVAGVACLVRLIPGFAVGAPFTVLVFLMYNTGLVKPPRRAATVLGLTVLVCLLITFIARGNGPVSPVEYVVLTAVSALLLGAACAIGGAVRARRAFLDATMTTRAEQAVGEERLRIARELHDIVAHGMSLISVKAAVGNHVALEQPEEARDALRVIERTSREALAELRQMLGVLRSDSADGADTGELDPAPGMADVPALVDRAALAGVSVRTEISGIDDLGEGTGLAVYRIVQESVTNVVKHAAPARCEVRVRGEDGVVRIEVTDDGPGVKGLPSADGHGLVGMRERVLAYGGEFTAGPGKHGGFTVTATIPYGETS